MKARPQPRPAATPLWPIVLLTFGASLGTGMLWNGIPFITEKDYAFSEARNLWLYVCVGVVYIISASFAGLAQRTLERWLSPRAVIAAMLLVQASICVLPLLARGQWVVWLVTVIFSATSALLWPIVESYLSAGRHGPAMRSAIGWWNIAWMAAVAVPLWVMAPLMTRSPRLAIVGLGVCLLGAVCMLRWFNAAPAAHDAELSRAHRTDEYPLLLQSARVMLPLSYILLAALSPLLPFILQRLDVVTTWQTPSAAAWMMARVVVVAVMWRITFWHGRWGTLVTGGVALAGGFITVVAAPSLPLLLLGLILLGAGLGIVYYAALYYAMAVGSAAVDAGGRHEALIGVGYAIGPGAALSALAFNRNGPAALIPFDFHPLLIMTICAIAGIGFLAAALPYRHAWRARRR